MASGEPGGCLRQWRVGLSCRCPRPTVSVERQIVVVRFDARAGPHRALCVSSRPIYASPPVLARLDSWLAGSTHPNRFVYGLVAYMDLDVAV